MKIPSVPLEEWRSLYERAFHFLEMAPWEWMDETQLFGITDPRPGRISIAL
jgi:hypothetical protein